MSYTNYSLAQLQAMNPEELIAAFPQKRERWINAGYKVNFSRLIKAIILATKELRYPLTENRGCREVWYNPVKPILSKVEQNRLEAHKYMALFESILSEMVKDGVLTYADLGVNDFRTLKETFNQMQTKAQCWSNILLFIEKDGAFVHLTPLKELFNINIISGGGWSNTAGIERLLRALKEKGITRVVVFTLTDYDPFGFAIDHEFVNKCETLGLEVIEHHRIGIGIEHATPEILDVQKYPIKRGKKLSVEGVCFDSNKWLADYGIDGKYGLEIEAVSAQPNGHQFLREIVAQELLKYLNEADRIEEITTEAWKEAPFDALRWFLFSIDNSDTEKENLENLYELPKEYISYENYHERTTPIIEKMESETEDIREEITDLEDQLEVLREDKKEAEEPYQKRIHELSQEYWKSRDLLTYVLWQMYEASKDKFPREEYDLGFPEGSLLEAVKQNKTLASFIEQLNTEPFTDDLKAAFRNAIEKGVVAKNINDILKNNGGSYP